MRTDRVAVLRARIRTAGATLGDRGRRAWYRTVAHAVATRQFFWRARAETLTGLALVGGWLLVTYSIVAIAPPRIVWPASIGLLLLSATGWGLVRTIATKGLYVLHRVKSRG